MLEQTVSQSVSPRCKQETLCFHRRNSHQGVCNILLQRKDEGDPSKDYHIISCDSPTIKRGWVKYAPFEAETTAIVFLCTKEEF